MHIVSDLLIALAYYSIPIILVYFVHKRKDLPFNWIFLLFSTFIIACGTTHIMEVWTLWHPIYWVSGLIKAITALVSVYTAIELIPLVPQALALPSPAILETANAQLAKEIAERKQAEENLNQILDRLENIVTERTAELTLTNASLQAEIAERQRIEEALRESEQQFRATFQQAAVGIAHVGIDGRWLLVNQRFCDIVGYTFGELQLLTFQDITYPEDLTDDLNYVDQILAGEIQTYTLEKRFFCKNHSLVWISLTVSLVRDNSGNPKYFISVIEDISDRQRSQEQIRASLREKEVLLKEVYHRVKNNFQVISSLLSLQSEYITNKQDLQIFQQSQQRIASMALVHEKMYQSGDLSRINFREYVQELVASLCTSYDVYDGAITVQINIDDEILLGLDTAVPCGLIIHELVSNSLKYAFPGGRTGEITIAIQEIANHQIALTVSDNGVGLPENFNFTETASLGWQLVEALASQLTGDITIQNDIGVEFLIAFSLV